MALSLTIFNALAPEFSDLDTAGQTRRDILAGVAASQISASIFGTNYDAALALLTAHYLKKNPAVGGSAGFKTGEKVGDISISYENSSKSGSDLSTTSYGEQFIRLRKQSVMTPKWVGGCADTYHR